MNKALEDLQAGRDPFAERNANDGGELFQNLAKWSKWLIILAGVLAFAVNHTLSTTSPGDPSSGYVRLGTGGICVMMMLASLVMGVIALFAIRKYGTDGILRPALIGVGISVVCLCIFGTGFVQGFRNARARAELNNQVQQIRARERMDYTNKTELTAAEEMKRINQAQGILNQAAQNSTGDQALISQAMSAYLAKAKVLLVGLAKAAEPLREIGGFNLKDMTQPDQLKTQMQQVKNFIVANDKLLAFTRDTDNILIREFQNAHLSQTSIDEAMRGYHRGVAGQTELAVKLRVLDKRYGEDLLGALGLLNDNWGRWQYNEEKDKVSFDDQAIWTKYLGYLNDARAAQKEEASLQQQLLGVKRK